MTRVSVNEMLKLRLASQLLAQSEQRTPREIVTWLGAMQAQDVESGHWSIGVRGADLKRSEVVQACEDRSILRTWPMRGTIHFVPAVDAAWMLQLTGVRALAGAAGRRRQLELDDNTLKRAVNALSAALYGRRLTRAECIEVFEGAGISPTGQRGYHLLWHAAHLGVTCIGPQQGKQQTFVLLNEWVPNPRQLERDDALTELAIRYFQSHGPATRQDFARWTGLTLSDADRAIEGAKKLLTAVDVDGTPSFMSTVVLDSVFDRGDDIVLLPGFDEYVLGYKDRSLFIDPAHASKIVPGNNGVFLPTMVERGHVIGTWKRNQRPKKTPDIALSGFNPLTANQRARTEAAVDRYGSYLDAME